MNAHELATQIQEGDAVFLRARCTRRAAVMLVEQIFFPPGQTPMLRLQPVTDYTNWDAPLLDGMPQHMPLSGPVLVYAGDVEAVRRG